ncbi:hypothetical protein H311_01150 [Anncaliia algerae PRA109]|uniref:Uncharacterized protein n=1 Tax=Anncaliia algerae PRA339 TaxID=1288291 RepID=A0A059EYF5_9MICR|nr:hypothetical protein H311_01150 [Anncaliia algerae PRA109]KCZ79897.1 hypothetical protein H312_02699 [Anncaliia algerae PRA339]
MKNSNNINDSALKRLIKDKEYYEKECKKIKEDLDLTTNDEYRMRFLKESLLENTKALTEVLKEIEFIEMGKKVRPDLDYDL